MSIVRYVLWFLTYCMKRPFRKVVMPNCSVKSLRQIVSLGCYIILLYQSGAVSCFVDLFLHIVYFGLICQLCIVISFCDFLFWKLSVRSFY